ncbi:MAG: PQQ-binding-like beta-propeller repeat protein, partial [Planctomycetota bacterium]
TALASIDWSGGEDSAAPTAWESALVGYGQSSPVTDGKTVYVTSVSGDKKEQLHLQAFDLSTGEELWRREAANSTPEPNNSYVSRAAPTPVCDEAGVVAMFEGGNLIAYTPSGDERWTRDLVSDYGKISARHGLAASLEQDELHVFAWVERQDDPYVVAIDKSSGEVVWRSPGIGATSWSSPRLVPVGDAEHLVLSAIGTVAGYDPQSGQRLWTLEGVSGNSSATPAPLGDGRFLIGAMGGGGESDAVAQGSSNGVVEITELADGRFQADYLWRAKRATTSFGSPIAYGGHAYFVNRSGVVYCVDTATGDEKYAKRLPSSIWATPVASGENVYFLGKDGSVAVVKSGSSFELLAEGALWPGAAAAAGGGGPPGGGGPILYAAAIANDALLLRRGDRLYCVGDPTTD